MAAETSTFGADLKKRRMGHKWSQQQLANKTGITRATIGAYEENRAQPPFKKFLKICNAFGITNLFATNETN
jgi:transcriptional regulator with XRE-family HTH domain